MIAGYVLVFSDDAYEAIFPTADTIPRRLYESQEAVKAALDAWANTFETFRPVLYGQAYPYENTTFEGELSRKGRALYGWAELRDEDGDLIRYGLCATALLRR
jgi:hypothetical protein